MNDEIEISTLPPATGIDPVNDYTPIDNFALDETQRINRNTYLNLTSQPVGISDSQTLTNKTITSPAISSPVLSGTVTGTYTLGGTPTFPASVVTLTGAQTLTNKILTSPTINGGTLSNATVQVNSIAGFADADSGTVYGVGVTNGVIASAGLLNSVNTAAIQNLAVTTAKLADSAVTGLKIASYRLPFQNITTNTTYTNAVVQSGFSFVNGTGANSVSKTITFPTGFTTILGLIVGSMGTLNGSDPTSVTSITGEISGSVFVATATDVTLTTCNITVTADTGITIASGLRVGFSWMAIGTI